MWKYECVLELFPVQHPRLHDCHCYSHFLEATRFGPSTTGKESLISHPIECLRKQLPFIYTRKCSLDSNTYKPISYCVCDDTDLTAYTIWVSLTSKGEITLIKCLQWDGLTGQASFSSRGDPTKALQNATVISMTICVSSLRRDLQLKLLPAALKRSLGNANIVWLRIRAPVNRNSFQACWGCASNFQAAKQQFLIIFAMVYFKENRNEDGKTVRCAFHDILWGSHFRLPIMPLHLTFR